MSLSVRLDPKQSLALYLQIVHAVRDQIARDVLRPGDALPTVRELAQQLRVNPNTVSRAYSLLRQEGLLETRASQGTHVAVHARGEHLYAAREAELRMLVARLIGEGIARGFTLGEIEAAFVSQRARWHEQRGSQQPLSRQTRDQVIGLGSSDLCLELLIAQLQQSQPELHVHFATVGSLAGLMALARGEAHFAAAHLYDPATNDYNLPFVRRLLPGHALALITLAHRSQGFIVAKGNPKKIRGVRDLTRRGVRFVNRQRGSGTRVLLDEWLRKARVAQRRVQGYAREEKTHLAVATAIASGAADVGFGIQAAARSFELDFVPLASERFELILPRDDQLAPTIADVIARADFKQTVQALGGYDLKETGRIRYA